MLQKWGQFSVLSIPKCTELTVFGFLFLKSKDKYNVQCKGRGHLPRQSWELYTPWCHLTSKTSYKISVQFFEAQFMSTAKGTANKGNHVYIQNRANLPRGNNVIGDDHPFLLSDDKAVVLQMGHRFFIINHCFMQFTWYLWPHSRVPISSLASYSSCKAWTKSSLRTRSIYLAIEQISKTMVSLFSVS